jgi:hypothetical protein
LAIFLNFLYLFKKKPTKSASSTSTASKKSNKSEESNGDTQKDSDGNTMYMVIYIILLFIFINFKKICLKKLSKMRFVSVSEFRGKPLVNIREYYESNGKILPGKKGISLAIDQWEQLKKFIPKLDEAIKKSK